MIEAHFVDGPIADEKRLITSEEAPPVFAAPVLERAECVFTREPANPIIQKVEYYLQRTVHRDPPGMPTTYYSVHRNLLARLLAERPPAPTRESRQQLENLRRTAAQITLGYESLGAASTRLAEGLIKEYHRLVAEQQKRRAKRGDPLD